jgi:Tfp pilus assembly protein PilV
MKKINASQSGFTILEILAATIIFFMVIGAVVNTRTRSLRSVAESGLLTQAQTLAEMKMTEMEIFFQNAVDKGDVKSAFGTQEGSFESPYETFKWKAEFKENPLLITQNQILAFLKGYGLSNEDSENQLQQSKLILSNLNKALKENMGELVVTVKWKFQSAERELPLVTHLIPKKPKITFSQNTDIDMDSTNE